MHATLGAGRPICRQQVPQCMAPPWPSTLRIVNSVSSPTNASRRLSFSLFGSPTPHSRHQRMAPLPPTVRLFFVPSGARNDTRKRRILNSTVQRVAKAYCEAMLEQIPLKCAKRKVLHCHGKGAKVRNCQFGARSPLGSNPHSGKSPQAVSIRGAFSPARTSSVPTIRWFKVSLQSEVRAISATLILEAAAIARGK